MKKSKNNKLMIGVISVVVVLIAVLVISHFLGNTRLDVSGDPRLHVIGNSEMEAILNDDSGVRTFVYIGHPRCPFCIEFEPILEGVLNDLDRELPYFETDLADLEDSRRRSEIFDRLGVTGVPVIVYIENGQVVDALIGLQQQEAVLEFFEANGGL